MRTRPLTPGPIGPAARPSRGAGWPALLLGLACASLFVVTWQAAVHGDGIFLLQKLHADKWTHSHILMLPVTRWLSWAARPLVTLSHQQSLQLVSSLAGGAAVALTVLWVRRLFRMTSTALVAGCLMALLPGFWFLATATEVHALHAACSALLLLGLVGLATARPSVAWAWGWLVGLGIALTPASHLSGVAALLPVAVTLLVTGRWRAAWFPVLVGLAVFASCLWHVTQIDSLVRGYFVHFGGARAGYHTLLDTPWRLGRAFAVFGREFLMYSLPASTLMPAGLYRCFRLVPRTAWVLLAWLVAWPLVAFPIGLEHEEFGAYYLPVLGVQAALAVVALRRLVRSTPRVLLAVLLACLPALALRVGQGTGLQAWLGCAVALVLLVRAGDGKAPSAQPAPVTRAGRMLWILPLAAAVYSALVYVPGFSDDAWRDRIREVRAFTHDEGLHLVFDPSPAVYLWELELSQVPGGAYRFENLALIDFARPDQRAAVLEGWRTKIRKTQRTGQPVYLILEHADHLDDSLAESFVEELRDVGLVAPEGAPPGVLRLELRR